MSLKLCYSNLVNAAATVITSNSEVASLPDDNVKTFWKSKVWRATGDTAEWIKFDFGSAQDVWVVAIVGHNFSSGATVTLQLNAADAWGAPSVSQAITYDADIMLYVFTSAQSYRWARITIADAANSDGYVECGRIFLGGYLSPERDFPNGWSVEQVDPSQIGESFDGAESIDVKTSYKIFSFPFQNTLTDNIDTVYNDRKLTGDLFIVADSGNVLMTDGLHDLSRYVRFLSSPSFTGSHLKRRDFFLSFKELVG